MELRKAIRAIPFASSAYALAKLIAGRNARFEADYKVSSGVGSTIDATTAIARAMPELMKSIDAASMLDIPCGDYQWMSRVVMPSVNHYIGADIIHALIQSHQSYYGASRHREFRVLDIITDDLPRVDVVFCRDCLVHFSERLVWKALRNIKRSGSRYLLTTTFPTRKNADIVTGNWRPLNLCAKPFGFPAPLQIVTEANNPPYDDKSMALWRIEDLPV